MAPLVSINWENFARFKRPSQKNFFRIIGCLCFLLQPQVHFIFYNQSILISPFICEFSSAKRIMRRALSHPDLIPSKPALINLRKIQHTQVFKDGHQAESECVFYVANFPGLSSETATVEYFSKSLHTGGFSPVSIEAHHSYNGSIEYPVVASIRGSFISASVAKNAAEYIRSLNLHSIHKDKFIKVGTCASQDKANLIVENIGLLSSVLSVFFLFP